MIWPFLIGVLYVTLLAPSRESFTFSKPWVNEIAYHASFWGLGIFTVWAWCYA